MKKILRPVFTLCTLAIALSGCASTQVTRISTNKVLDLSGRWNDTDSRLVAEQMVKDISNSPWLERFQRAHAQYAPAEPSETAPAADSSGATSPSSNSTSSGSPRSYQVPRPILIVGSVVNKSHEHIEPDTFIKDIERALISGGEIRIVANSKLKELVRSERADQTAQEGFVSPETQKRFGRELGADYMVFGTINTIVDVEGNNKVIFYQVSLELIDVETSEVVWVGDKKIKKYRGGKKIKKKYQGTIPTS